MKYPKILSFSAFAILAAGAGLWLWNMDSPAKNDLKDAIRQSGDDIEKTVNKMRESAAEMREAEGKVVRSPRPEVPGYFETRSYKTASGEWKHEKVTLSINSPRLLGPARLIRMKGYGYVCLNKDGFYKSNPTTEKEVIKTRSAVCMNMVQEDGYYFRSPNFSGADLSGVDMREADMNGGDFSGANLSNADIRGMRFQSANFTGANLEGADLRTVSESYSDFTGASFKGANLKNTSLSAHSLKNADFTEAILEKASLGEKLAGAKFDKANMREYFGGGGDMTHASFIGADLTNASLQGIRFGKANFTGAILEGAFIAQATGTGDFTGAKMRGVRLQNFRMPNSSFRNADISGAELNGTTLNDADFRGANLTGTVFLKNMDSLEGAVYNSATVFHAGFTEKDAKAMGMRKVD